MRHGKYWAGMAVLALWGCTPSEPLKDMVGYVPPTSLPAPAKRTLVRDEVEATWAHLIDVLGRSSFEIEQVDRSKNLLVARYSGDPEPYVDCGSIVTYQGGNLDQITGATKSTSLNYKLEDKPVVLNRTLNLDSRIIVTLADQTPNTVIETKTTYVVTKTVDVVDAAGGVTKGNRETISFNTGGRGEFSKGTACQPNGFLDIAVLESIPNIVGADDVDQAQRPEDVTAPSPAAGPASPEIDTVATAPKAKTTSEALTTGKEGDEDIALSIETDQADAAALPPAVAVEPQETPSFADWILPDAGLPRAALPEALIPDAVLQPGDDVLAEEDQNTLPSAPPVPLPSSTEGSDLEAGSDAAEKEQAALLPEDGVTLSGETGVDDALPQTIVDDTTTKLLDALDCRGVEWHFCELVELTAAYRKRNITKLFGLTVNTAGSFDEQIVGGDLRLDFLFPSFPSYLHVAYARRDGGIDHVLSSSETSPADRAHRFEDFDQAIPGPEGLALIVAIATDEPLFPSQTSSTESAEAYLSRLKERLAELDVDGPEGQIAASQLLIYVDNAGS